MSELEIAGHRFTDAGLVETALTHSSYLHEHPDLGVHDFERLEFLGDAVVDLVIGEELFRRFPDATEGQLTSLRASLVSSPALAEIGRGLGLTERARLGRGEDDTGGRGRMGLAASLYEAVIGAIYLDAGFDRARIVVLDTMGDLIDVRHLGKRNPRRRSCRSGRSRTSRRFRCTACSRQQARSIGATSSLKLS